ncbi:unnamed protein product [Mucor fragilis]
MSAHSDAVIDLSSPPPKLLENKPSVTENFMLPEKRASLLQKYKWLVKDYENKNPESYTSLPISTFIVANNDNSCFIDAFFELFLNAVLPFVDLSFVDQSNTYDCLLMNAFESYSKQTRFGIRAATSSARQFVWSMTEQKVVSGARQLAKSFPKGLEGDTLDLASTILERLLSVFASKICTFSSLQCERKVSCSSEKEHSHVRDDFFPSFT